MRWMLEGEAIEWRGPAPFVFVDIDAATSAEIKDAAAGLEYWGQVAVRSTIGETTFETALFPKDGRYLLPLRLAVREATDVELGDTVTVDLEMRLDR